MESVLFLLLVLVCPLMMFFMMRGMHGGQGGNAQSGHAHGMGGCHGSGSDEQHGRHTTMSMDELKHERDELNALISERAEQAVGAHH
jgi:hypothetical protein